MTVAGWCLGVYYFMSVIVVLYYFCPCLNLIAWHIPSFFTCLHIPLDVYFLLQNELSHLWCPLDSIARFGTCAVFLKVYVGINDATILLIGDLPINGKGIKSTVSKMLVWGRVTSMYS